MSEYPAQSEAVDLLVGLPALGPAVLGRLVSAAAARAELGVDRVVNAMTAVDALSDAIGAVREDRQWQLRVELAPGEVTVRVRDLAPTEAAAIREAASLQGIGDVLAHTAKSVTADPDTLSIVLT